MPKSEEIPYGLMIGPDCRQLVDDPTEKVVILEMFKCLVRDMSMSQAASELNAQGFRTRAGKPWGPAAVFDMLPRLIEVGHQTFGTTEWAEIRRTLLRRAS